MDYVDLINKEGLSEHIVNNAYIRRLKVKHSNIITSRIWKHERLWIVIEGDFIYKTTKEQGRIKAPYVGLAPYGS